MLAWNIERGWKGGDEGEEKESVRVGVIVIMKEKCGGCELVEKNKNNNIECSRDEQLQKVEQKATNSRGSACLARPKSGGRVQFSRGR